MSSIQSRFLDLIKTLRPNQWTKNAVVLAAFVFAYWDKSRVVPLQMSDLIRVIPAVIIFCMTSSAIYIINDIHDKEADSAHPLKKFRPIPAGRISIPAAWLLAVTILTFSLGTAFILSRSFATVILAYILMQTAYTFWLKRVALVDVLIIASGFVLRAIAGAMVLNHVNISVWLLICTFLLALFLGLCKRRHEKVAISTSNNATQRPSLNDYSTQLLDILIMITCGMTILSYAIYTIWPETVHKFGTKALAFTVPFVIFGMFRYLYIVYRHEKGDRPEKILLTDVPLLIAIVLYGLSVVVILRWLAGNSTGVPLS